MADENIVEGRKTFFIAPDTSLLPESYLEDFLARGYETYIVDDFRFCPLDEKVEIILSTFPDSILFFFVDTNVGIDWEKYIAQLQKKYDGNILIGVLYIKRKNEEESRVIEKYYLFNVGIQCGCIALEYQKLKNFGLIDRVMHANQACGRRKNVRALCDGASKANFDYDNMIVKGKVIDISLSHFSFVPDPNLSFADIPIGTKIKNVFINFNGMHFKSDATLMAKRQINGKTLHVFLLQKPDGTLGLLDDQVFRVSEKIYKTVTDRVKTLLQTKYDEYAKAHVKQRSQ